MNNEVEKLTANNVTKDFKSNKVGSIRGNTVFFNMLLYQLKIKGTTKDFLDPFGTSKKTSLIYRRESKIFYQLGITSIKKYNNQIIKKICEEISPLSSSFFPYISHSTCSENDLIRLLINIEDIKTHLSAFFFDPYGKMSFSNRPLSLDTIIYQVSSMLSLYKLARRKEERLYNFLFRNSDTEFLKHFEDAYLRCGVDIYLKKEGNINREFIATFRMFIISVFEIQLRHYRHDNTDLAYVNLGSIPWLDRIISTALDM